MRGEQTLIGIHSSEDRHYIVIGRLSEKKIAANHEGDCQRLSRRTATLGAKDTSRWVLIFDSKYMIFLEIGGCSRLQSLMLDKMLWGRGSKQNKMS